MLSKTKLSKVLTLAFGGGLALGGLPVLGQTGAPAAQLDRVEITGSSIKRIEGEGATEVQVLTRQDIDRLGVQTTEQLLMTISAMSSSGQTQLSSGAGTSTYGMSGVSLRGLGQERTLVLMNGKRLAPFASGDNTGGAAVNVNGIPLGAIDRVEILKDGASAIYGADAMAGVVNFIMLRNFEGLQLGGTYGTPTTSGGGQQYNVNAIFGLGDISKENYSLVVSAQWQKTEALYGADRAYAKTANLPPWFSSPGTGQGNIQGNWDVDAKGVPTTRVPGYVGGGAGGGFGNPLMLGGDNCAQINMYYQGQTSKKVGYCQYDTASKVALIPQNENTAYTANFQYKLNESATFYADWYYNRSVVTQSIQESPLRTSFMETDDLFAAQGVAPVLLVRPGSAAFTKYVAPWIAANPGLGLDPTKPVGVTARVFDFGPRTTQDTSTQQRLVGGIRGDVLGQDYNVAVYQNTSKLSGTVTDGFFSQLGFAKATQNADWNPWQLQQSDAFQAAIAPAKYVGPTLAATVTTTNVDATMSGAVTKLPAGEMNYAAGYQYRKESYVTSPGAALFTGDIAGMGGATKGIDVGRNINSLFGELQIPVIKNLDLNLAARLDDYSDFGNQTNYMANFRWQPVQQFLVRGNYATGFRAPTLANIYTPVTLGTSVIFYDPVTDQNGLQVNQWGGGNPNLQPEKSNQWTLGAVWQPMSSFSAGLDYFNIEIKHAIGSPSTQEIVSGAAAGNPIYTGLVVRDPPGTGDIVEVTSIIGNLGTIKASGVDINLNYRENMGPGRLDANLSGTYYINYDINTPAGTFHKVATIVDGRGNPLPGADTGGVVLRYKQYASATWTQGAWATTLGWSYRNGYNAGWDLNGNPTSIGSENLFDLQVQWKGVKNLSVTLGARNIFNTQPDIFVPASNQFQQGYDANNYDPRGRFVYLTGTYKF